jgi:hypothetical protein
MMRRASTVLLTMLMIAAAASAHAAGSSQVWGPQIGFSTDPSQVVFGGHMGFEDVAPRLDFVPSVDIGVGDNVTVFSFNGDFHYRIEANSRWQPYFGAGVALHTASVSDDFGGGSSTVGGGNLIVGAGVPTNRGSRFYVEGRFGLGDGPTFKALAGWSFPMH